MTAAATGTAPPADLHRAARRQTLVVAWLLLGLAVFVAVVFGTGVTGNATFRLTLPRDAIPLPNLVVPAAPFIYVVAGILAFFGVRQFLRGGARWSSLFLGIGLLLAVAAFLVWAADGKSFSLTGMLNRPSSAPCRSPSAVWPGCFRNGLRSSTSASRGCSWPALSPARWSARSPAE